MKRVWLLIGLENRVTSTRDPPTWDFRSSSDFATDHAPASAPRGGAIARPSSDPNEVSLQADGIHEPQRPVRRRRARFGRSAGPNRVAYDDLDCIGAP